MLDEIAPLILAAQGTGRMAGFRPMVSYEGVVHDDPQTVRLGA